MTEKHILFGKFEFPVEKGLEYLVNENIPETDFLLINEPSGSFSMTFEKDFPIFTVPQGRDRDFCLFELRRQNRIIKFFCPEKRENLDTAVWYFCLELYDDRGEAHVLPGQVMVEYDGECLRKAQGKPRFIKILEQVRLNEVPHSSDGETAPSQICSALS